MNQRLDKIKDSLLTWDKMGKNYSPSFDWIELNEIAVELGNKSFNLGCSGCRLDLANYLLAVVKEQTK